MTPRDPTAGVTLVEMVVALAIFALIGGAGYAMLDQVLRTDSRTSGRLERLGDLQRALFVIGQDLAKADGHSLRQDGGALRLGRDGVQVGFRLDDGVLRRDAGASAQALVADVEALRWRFLAGGVWRTALPAGTGRPQNPQAVEMVLTLPGGQAVRQVADLPVEAD